MTTVSSPSDVERQDAPPAAPVDDPLAQAALRLDAWMDMAQGAAHQHLDQVQADLLTGLVVPLRASIQGLAAAHQALLAPLPLNESEALPPRAALWEALVTYRSGAERDVVLPFQRTLAHLSVGTVIDAATLQPFSALASFSHDAPGRLTRREPDGLLDPTPADRRSVRLRKSTARLRRGLASQRRAVRDRLRSVVGKEPAPGVPAAQTVYLQALLDYHAQVRLGAAFADLHEAVHQHVAQTLATLVQALDAWLHALLRAEAALDRADLHDLDALVWPDEALPDTLTADGTGSTDTATSPQSPLTEDEIGLVRAAFDAALVLQRTLEDAASLTLAPLGADAGATLDAAQAILWEDVDRSARVRLRPPRMLPAAAERPASRAQARASAWQAWYPTLDDRIELMVRLLDLRALLLRELDGLVGRVGQGGLKPVLVAVQSVVDDLAGLSQAAEQACQTAAANDDVAGLTRALRSLLQDAVRKTEGQLVRRLQTSSLSTALERGLSAAQERIAAAVEALPEDLHVATDLETRPVDPTAKPDRTPVRTVTRGVLDQSFLARLGEGGDALRQPLFRVLAKAEEVQSAVHYNLDAALEELGVTLPGDLGNAASVTTDDAAALEAEAQLLAVDAPASIAAEVEAREDADGVAETNAEKADDAESAASTSETASVPPPSATSGADQGATAQEDVRLEDEAALDEDGTVPNVTPAERIASARELTVTGLARSAERLAGIVEPMHAPWNAFLGQATQVFERRWGMVHQRLEAAGVEGQFLDMRLRMADESARMGRAAQDKARSLWGTTRRLARLGWQRLRSLIRKGQSAAGLMQNASAKEATLDALGAIATLRANLPLVYRRLFSFDPIADPLLLQGRDAPLQTLNHVVTRWQAKQPSSAVVVTAPMGGGATSFLRVAAGTLLTGHRVQRVDLTDRFDDPDMLADTIAQAFEIDLGEPSAETGAPSRLALLERHLLAQKDGPRRVCLLEHLEHLMLRTGGGLAPLETVLTFLSRTDHCVLWIATMNESAWRFVAKTAPALTGLVMPLPLPALDRAALEAVVLKRHARSGLPLVFEEPATPAPLLVRRLRAAKTEADRQDLLRADYFDRLARNSGRSVGLALFYWLRSIDFEADGDQLTVRSLPPLDFAFLATYDLPRTFALKALLQHGTLTLTEYQRVFRATTRESYLLFESLANELLITRATSTPTATGAPATPLAIRVGDRYRIHPLLTHPVTEALRSRNMV